MGQLTEKLKHFILFPDDDDKVRKELKKNNFNFETNVISNIKFDDDIELQKTIKVINSTNDLSKPGLYFWIFVFEGIDYKLYVGSAGERKSAGKNKKGISGRLYEYLSNFQPSLPNDYKIQFFNEYISKFVKEPSYKIYFSLFEDHFQREKFDRSKLISWEDEVRKSINPIFSNKNFFSSENNKEIMKGYFGEYTHYFNEKLTKS